MPSVGKDPFGATPGTEWTFRIGAPVLTCPCRFSFLFFLSSSCSTTTLQAATQDENDLRIPITLFPALTASFLSYFLYFLPLLKLLNNIYRHKDTTTRRPYAPRFILFWLFLYMLTFFYSILIISTSEAAITVQNLDTISK